MPIDPSRVRSLFLTASGLDDPAERAAYLDRECRGDADLLARVEALLRAEETTVASGNPETDPNATTAPDGQEAADASNGGEGEGAVVGGRYVLVEPIGEGGMGTVWRARQTEPVKRFVAVKLIKAGMDSRQVLARFEAERQALALMDHPNIAKVLDGGLHDGRPYFVMELVNGRPITEYCDQKRLSPHGRLELFATVCQAIQHAHQKGIIHRDIKPSNVLVALYDDQPVVKVIDFGVAKATGEALTEATLETGPGGVIGTPQYMSPEQATLGGQDVDTRSDVYSLGVLLYELLTGSPPFSRGELERKGLLEILRVVREDDPPRPSDKLSAADTPPSVSANRSVEPRRLTALLRDELDWVVMKALEKDRGRRYETANGFAADILRYLAGEPVRAHPPSAGYRLRKFVRRHRAAVIAASLVMLALVAGMAGTTWGLFEARRQEKLARAAAAAEKAANEQSQKRLAQIEKGNALLASIFQDLDINAVKEGTEPLEAVLAHRLVKAAEQLEGASVGDPLAVAQLQNQMGSSLISLGYSREAIGLLEKARQTRAALKGADDPDALESMGNLAVAHGEAGEPDLALPLLEEGLRLRRAKRGVDDPATFIAMNSLAWAYLNAGKPDLALPLLEEVVKLQKAKLGVDHPDTLASMSNLASAYKNAGKPNLAPPLFEETLRLMKAKLGVDHPNTLTAMHNLAAAYQAAGKRELAPPLLEEALKRAKAKLGADHPDTLSKMIGLGRAYQSVGKLDLALPLLEEAVGLYKAKLGVDHPRTLEGMDNLGQAYQSAGKLDLAPPLFEEVLRLRKAKLGADHPDTLASMSNLALAYQSAGKLDLALPLLEEAVRLHKAKMGVDHPDTLVSMIGLALTYQAAGEHDLAPPLLEEILKLQQAKLGADHPDTVLTMAGLASAYAEARRLDEAAAMTKDALAIAHEKLSPKGPAFLNVLIMSARTLLQTGAFADAEPVCRECLSALQRDRPNSWRVSEAMSMLGGALLGQKKYAEAEPLLAKGYEGMAARDATIAPRDKVRVAEALDRLIELAEAADKPDDAAKYKALRAQFPPPNTK